MVSSFVQAKCAVFLLFWLSRPLHTDGNRLDRLPYVTLGLAVYGCGSGCILGFPLSTRRVFTTRTGRSPTFLSS